MSEITLSFGKYKSMKIEEVYEKDRDYLLWLSKQKTLNITKDVSDWLAEKFYNSDKSCVVTFGKHKGSTINHIWNVDRKYFDWLKSNEYVNNNMPTLVADIQKLSVLE